LAELYIKKHSLPEKSVPGTRVSFRVLAVDLRVSGFA
jgi:hypothetical protein